MKRKRPLSTLMIAMLIVGMTMMMANFASVSAEIWGEIALIPETTSPYATIVDGNITYFTEENLTSLTAHDFNVTMKITNATDWTGFGAYIWYNTTLLDAVGATIRAPGATNLAPIDPVTYEWIPINDTLGRIMFGFTIPLPGLTGNYDIIEIQFHITHAPPRETVMAAENKSVSTLLYLNGTSVVDKFAVDQAGHYENKSGYYEYLRPQIVAGAPTALFTWSPTFPYVSDTVTVDGSGSLTGDSVIVSWDWDITGPATWTTANGASTRQFHCDGPGTVTVTLNITNGLGLWDIETHDIEQREIIGPRIDLFTEHERQYPEGTWTPFIGEGDHMDADAYSPGENVTLFANVTYNGDIVQNIVVGFEVKHPRGQETGEPFLVRTARTNESGIATIWFRLPIPGPTYPELNETAYFGHWFVIAKCKLQDDIINDTLRFDVDWIVRIIDVHTFPYNEWYKSEYIGINVTLKNIAWIPRWVTLVVTVYDDCDVPIGQIVDVVYMDAIPMVCHPFVDSFQYNIHVPKWAYVGDATVYANAFTELPQETGVPYCPEMSHGILIKVSSR